MPFLWEKDVLRDAFNFQTWPNCLFQSDDVLGQGLEENLGSGVLSVTQATRINPYRTNVENRVSS